MLKCPNSHAEENKMFSQNKPWAEKEKQLIHLIHLDYSRIEFARLPRSARNDDVI